MSLLGPDREQLVAAEAEFIDRAYAYQIEPAGHMAAEGIAGEPPRPSARDMPQIMSVSLLSVAAEAVLAAVLNTDPDIEVETND